MLCCVVNFISGFVILYKYFSFQKQWFNSWNCKVAGWVSRQQERFDEPDERKGKRCMFHFFHYFSVLSITEYWKSNVTCTCSIDSMFVSLRAQVVENCIYADQLFLFSCAGEGERWRLPKDEERNGELAECFTWDHEPGLAGRHAPDIGAS